MNIIPLFVFKEKAAFKNYSLYPLIIMIGMIMIGLFNCSKISWVGFRRIPDLIPGMSRLFAKSSEDENERALFWQAIVFWIAIPFYIPCIFFCTNIQSKMWTLLVFIAPQIIYILYFFIIAVLIDAKKDKRIKKKHEQELKEQERCEELGYTDFKNRRL